MKNNISDFKELKSNIERVVSLTRDLHFIKNERDTLNKILTQRKYYNISRQYEDLGLVLSNDEFQILIDNRTKRMNEIKKELPSINGTSIRDTKTFRKFKDIIEDK